jgi:hypothetical protein
VLSLALSRRWPVHQLDVKNVFLYGTLTETVYCQQPSGFEDSAHPDYVCRLNKSLYGLKQAPRAWYSRFATYLLSLGFAEAKSDTSPFIYQRGFDTAYLLLYVDDIILTASSTGLRQRIVSALQQEFAMKDLSELHHFLGMHVHHCGDGLLLSQEQYMLEILDRAGMPECKPCSTPVDTNPKVSATDGAPVADASDFRSLAGALQCLTFTMPDIAYAVQQVCLHMHDPREPHLAALKCILRYICGTLQFGLLLRLSSCSDLVVYTDADWAGCPDTCKSTLGYAVFLGDNLISWSSKRQTTVSRSSAEAEYRAVTNGVAEATWLRQLLQELCAPLHRATLVYCDNTSTPSTCPPTWFSINARSILRLTSTSSTSVLPLVISASCMFQHHHSTSTFSPKGCLLHCLRSSGPVWTCAVPDDQTAGGGVRILYRNTWA